MQALLAETENDMSEASKPHIVLDAVSAAPLEARVLVALGACIWAGFFLALFTAPFWVGCVVVAALVFLLTPLVAL